MIGQNRIMMLLNLLLCPNCWNNAVVESTQTGFQDAYLCNLLWGTALERGWTWWSPEVPFSPCDFVMSPTSFSTGEQVRLCSLLVQGGIFAVYWISAISRSDAKSLWFCALSLVVGSMSYVRERRFTTLCPRTSLRFSFSTQDLFSD